MQKWVSKIQILLFVLIGISSVSALDASKILLRADSLFQQKKYTDAQQLYKQLYQAGYSSPATLLKMAFVHEGLGETAEALFFLSAYYEETEDLKAYDKIQVLANARNLNGYEEADYARLLNWLANRNSFLIGIFSGLSIIAIALMMFFNKRSLSGIKNLTGFLALLLIFALFFTINFLQTPAKGVIGRQAYFMSGPSAGAEFLGLIPDGNRVALSGEEDIWMKISWNGKDGFVRKADLILRQ